MYQKIIRSSLWSSLAICSAASFLAWPSWPALLVIWLLYPALALLLCFVLGFMAGVAADEMTVVVAPEDQIRLTIGVDNIVERSERTIGIYKDQPIHEWVKAALPNERVETMFFERIINLDDGVSGSEFPENRWWIIVGDGLLYVQPEKQVQG